MQRLTAAVCLFWIATAQAAPTSIAVAEINYLLSAVENSDCRFFRNGTWYDAKSAAAHLRYKYENLAAKELIRDSEDFIDRAATKSSLSGQDYAIKCGEDAAVSSRLWLTNLLTLYRESHRGDNGI